MSALLMERMSDRTVSILMALMSQGWHVEQGRGPYPYFRPAVYIVGGGGRISLREMLRRLRSLHLQDALCATCNAALPRQTRRLEAWHPRYNVADAARVRGARVDRRYCSNACRQRAYRNRHHVNVNRSMEATR